MIFEVLTPNNYLDKTKLKFKKLKIEKQHKNHVILTENTLNNLKKKSSLWDWSQKILENYVGGVIKLLMIPHSLSSQLYLLKKKHSIVVLDFPMMAWIVNLNIRYKLTIWTRILLFWGWSLMKAVTFHTSNLFLYWCWLLWFVSMSRTIQGISRELWWRLPDRHKNKT